MENDNDELDNDLDILKNLEILEEEPKNELQLAIKAGDPNCVRELLESGADVRYRRKMGYDALIDAAYQIIDIRDRRPLETMRLLLHHGVDRNGVTEYGETAIQVVWRFCNVEAVRLLLDAGADKGLLRWTPLIEAVAVGSADEVKTVLATNPSLEERDCWSRTAWLVALRLGDLEKAKLLHDSGADLTSRSRGDTPAIQNAVASRNVKLVRWVVDQGVDVDAADGMEMTALESAVADDDLAMVEALLDRGAKINPEGANPPIQSAGSHEMVMRLIAAGADLADLSSSGRRAVVGFGDAEERKPLEVSVEEYWQGRTRIFGSRNPERMDLPFWKAMVASGMSGYGASIQFEKERNYDGAPVWCAMRFGQSFTLMEDGRVFQIGGEHEDFYDPDFCIYNDVFIHEPDGSFAIYGYPEDVFPPTDFHTATLVGESVYIIGSLGYAGTRRYGETPIYRLDVETLRIERVFADGEAPGWIYKHRAMAEGGAIRIWGGEAVTQNGDEEVHEPNKEKFVLDLQSLRWSRV
jgi:ankyrin repeat protein